MNEVVDKARRIRLVIFDVDGVLTDGGLHIDCDGREHKVFHSRDGHGMKMLQESGVAIAVISGRNTGSVTHRMSGLGIEHVFQGWQDKLPAFEELRQRLGLAPEQIACVGDDVVDLPMLRRCGLAIAVGDAHELVREHADWVTPNRGGRGAARDVCELIMSAQGMLAPRWEQYLSTDP
jgi:3-deoxy-D-manno-octulosonate 8-phosphate phosphatase (KDO 8-P phosphatase)